MHLIYQKMGFKVQELKKENFLMEWVNVYVLFKNKKSEIFLFLCVENNSNETQALMIRS